MNGSEFVIVLTTLPIEGDAEGLASMLVQERLAACVNVLPEMESFYRWEGRIEAGRERQIVIKSTADRVDRLFSRLRAVHPFDVPEFLVLPVSDGSDAYLGWVRESTLAPEGEDADGSA